MKSGDPTRLKITPFRLVKKRRKRKKKTTEQPTGKPKIFYVQTNPESYSIAFNIQYRMRQGKGTTGTNPRWRNNPPRKLSFKFLFDSTNAIPTYSYNRVTSVTQEIEEFKKLTFDVNKRSHGPNYLMIEWGDLKFFCRMEKMTINFKLFSNDGKPIRAEVNASFIEVKHGKSRVREANLGSPDITKLHTVEDGDALPDLVEEEYGDVNYYMAVAQANKLIQFRNLNAGEKILFPPIRKS